MTAQELEPLRARKSVLVLLALLLAITLGVRLAGTAWDDFTGLQPDERHMIYVTEDMLAGLTDGRDRSVADLWFAADTSPLNPRHTGRLYVYGETPVLATTLVLAALDGDGRYDILRTGRILTAIVDTATALALFFLALAFTRSQRAALFAAALYACAPTPLQLANFYTVDPWLACASTCAMLALLALAMPGRTRGFAGIACFSGMAIGLAVACKVTGLFLAFPAAVALAFLLSRRGIGAATRTAAIMAAVAFVTFRLANPFAFAGPGPFGLIPDKAFVDGFKSLAGMTTSPDFPPNWAWTGYSARAFLSDLAFFGVGPVIAIGFVGGILSSGWKDNRVGWLIVASMLVPLGIVLLLSPNPALRYAAPAIPLMAAVAGIWLAGLRNAFGAAVLLAALWWGSGIVRLHVEPHPRVEASRWLWTLPEGTRLANETAWDEALPVRSLAPGEDVLLDPRERAHFVLLDMDITAPDTKKKAMHLADTLAQADYVVVSSGRHRESIPKLSGRFPMTTAYYEALSSGELCYASVRRFDRGYPLPGIRMNDVWAQEIWRVYDHPVVEIFQRQPCFDRSETQDFLSSRLPGAGTAG